MKPTRASFRGASTLVLAAAVIVLVGIIVSSKIRDHLQVLAVRNAISAQDSAKIVQSVRKVDLEELDSQELASWVAASLAVGDPEAEQDAFRRLDPNEQPVSDLDLLEAFVLLCYAARKAERALDSAEELVLRRPSSVLGRIVIAQVHMRSFEYAKAHALYAECVRMDSDGVWWAAHRGLYWSRYHLGQLGSELVEQAGDHSRWGMPEELASIDRFAVALLDTPPNQLAMRENLQAAVEFARAAGREPEGATALWRALGWDAPEPASRHWRELVSEHEEQLIDEYFRDIGFSIPPLPGK